MRNPADITHNGKTVRQILDDHAKWLRGKGGERANLRFADLSWARLERADLRGADLRGANLYGADLRGANLYGAYLRGTIGNMREIKSAQLDEWPLTWTQAKGEDIVLQIGCQEHPLAMWEKSDPRWIDRMDDDATDWWGKYREIVLALVKASPPVPYEWKGKDQ